MPASSRRRSRTCRSARCCAGWSPSFAPLAERKGLTLRLVPTTAVVVTDQGMLSRALMNLVSNAIRYTRQGGVLIGVRRHGSGIRVEVVDTGDRNPAATSTPRSSRSSAGSVPTRSSATAASAWVWRSSSGSRAC